MEYTITGEITCKKNSYRFARGRVFTSSRTNDWTDNAQWELKSQYRLPPISQEIAISATFYITRGKDIDNMLNTLFDAIKGVIIEDDMQIVKVTAIKQKVKKHETKTIFTITKM